MRRKRYLRHQTIRAFRQSGYQDEGCCGVILVKLEENSFYFLLELGSSFFAEVAMPGHSNHQGSQNLGAVEAGYFGFSQFWLSWPEQYRVDATSVILKIAVNEESQNTPGHSSGRIAKPYLKKLRE
jgi:hypothetical protein